MSSSTGFLLVGPLSILVLALLFLFTLLGLAGLSVAVARVFGGGGGPEGRRPGCLGGCLAAGALAFLTLLGVVGVAGFVALGAGALVTSVVGRVELNVPADGRAGRRSGAERVTLGIEVRGELGSELAELVRRALDEEADLSVTRGRDEDGDFALYEFTLPVDLDDLRELEREIERELDELDLPPGTLRLRRSRDL